MTREQEIEYQIAKLRAELSGIRSGILPYMNLLALNDSRRTASQIAEEFNLGITNANEYLRKLYNYGFLDRESYKVEGGGGRGYIYYARSQ